MALTTRRLDDERATAKSLVEAYQVASDATESARAALAFAVDARGAPRARASALLREAGLLRAVVRTVAAWGTRPAAALVIAHVALLGSLIASSDGAREFVDYGGHSALLRLLNSPDDNVVAAVDDLLANTADVCSSIGAPFPTLGCGRILDETELACRPLLQYDFRADGSGRGGSDGVIDAHDAADNALPDEGGDRGDEPIGDDKATWSVLVQSVARAQESQFTASLLCVACAS